MGDKTKEDVLTAPFTVTDTSGVVLEIVDKTAEREKSVKKHNESVKALKKDPKAKKPLQTVPDKTDPLYADNVELLVMHCSATSATKTGADVNQMHIDRGWSGCGYHYVIGPQDNPPKTKMVDGVEKKIVKVEMWRDPHTTKDGPGEKGAHASDLNPYSIGICWIGEKEAPTLEQRQALKLLNQQLQNDFPHAVVTGHRDCGAPKSCPNFDAAGLWKAENKDLAEKTPERFLDQSWSVPTVLAKRAERLTQKTGKEETTEKPVPPVPEKSTPKEKPKPEKKTADKPAPKEPAPAKPDDEKAPANKPRFIPWPGKRKTAQTDAPAEESDPVVTTLDSISQGAAALMALLSGSKEPDGSADLETADQARGRIIRDIAASAVLPAGTAPRAPMKIASPPMDTEKKTR